MWNYKITKTFITYSYKPKFSIEKYLLFNCEDLLKLQSIAYTYKLLCFYFYTIFMNTTIKQLITYMYIFEYILRKNDYFHVG